MAKKQRKTRVIDRGYKRIISNLNLIDKSRIETGFFKGGKVPDSDLTMAGIASVNEFGSRDKKIPERSFMRTSFDGNKVLYKKVAKQEMSAVLEGKRSVPMAMDRLGIRFVGDIKRKITSIRKPPNALSTIADKGFDNPLINKGTMRESVRHRKIIK